MGKIKYILRKMIIMAIYGYRYLIRPLLPPRCRFEPSCSRYAIEAITAHGCLKGGRYILARLIRCQPLCRGGYDPVPINLRDK